LVEEFTITDQPIRFRSARATIEFVSTPEPLESLSQRELRNESGRVLRSVSEGHSFVLTNRGVPVGRIVPLDAPAQALPITRPARRTGGWADLRIVRKRTTQEPQSILDDLRSDRA
jgi:prevent-host-death family protein